MSTRYVWEKHNVSLKTSSITTDRFIYSPPSGSNDSGKFAGYVGDRGVNFVQGKGWDLTSYSGNYTSLIIGTPQKINQTGTWFAVGKTENMAVVNADYSNTYPHVKWLAGSYSDNKIILQVFQEDSNESILNASPLNLKVWQVTGYDTTSSTLVGKVSSSSSGTYPITSNGELQDGYVYLYLGSDSIDAISTSSSSLVAGQSCNVIVSPGTNTYGGTISYLYQYSVNGGSWTTISTTANTSVSFTVPSNATSIQFRTRAQDGWGFTSFTYVTSPSYTVTSSTGGGTTLPSDPLEPDRQERKTIWVGVSNIARKVSDIYVGVNGTARKVVKGYYGVNGQARLFYGGMASGLLPSGYTELQYVITKNTINSSYVYGWPRLVTGKNCSKNTRIILDIQFEQYPGYSGNTVYGMHLAGATYTQENPQGFYINVKHSNGAPSSSNTSPRKYFTLIINDSNDFSTGREKNSGIEPTTHRSIIDFDLSSGTIGITDLELDQYSEKKYLSANIGSATFSSGGEIYLTSTTSSSAKTILRTYEYKHYEGNSLVQRLIPCKSPSNVVGFFDVVGNTFKSSSSNFPFTAGPEA